MSLPRQCIFNNYSKEISISGIRNEIIVTANRYFVKNRAFEGKMNILSFFII